MSLVAEPSRERARKPLRPPGADTPGGYGPRVLASRHADGSLVVAFRVWGLKSDGARTPGEQDPRREETSDPALSLSPPGGDTRIDRASRRAGPPYFLLARLRGEDTEVLAISGVAGEPTLPIFGSWVGAEEFLRSYASKGGWAATPVGVGELLSLLHGSCAEAECVALDPLPEIVDEGVIGLVSLPRRSFVESLLGRGRAWFEDRYREQG